MANGDVDAINERLNGLVNLLQVVGIDGVGSSNGNNNNSNSNSDAAVLEIIKKLQLAQADSPEILAALQSPELRALASLAAQKQASQKQPQQQHHRSSPQKKAPAPSLDDVMDDDDNYPKIGPGYSDDISVVSDMTTPTVMTRQNVHEEEYYNEVGGGPGSLPPLHAIGGVGPAQPSRPTGSAAGLHHSTNNHHQIHQQHQQPRKTKNMVGQVRPSAASRAIAKSGGAAAQRRLNYQMAMTKLQTTKGGEELLSPKKSSGRQHSSSTRCYLRTPQRRRNRLLWNSQVWPEMVVPEVVARVVRKVKINSLSRKGRN